MDYDTVNKAFRDATPILSEFICNELKRNDPVNWWKKFVLSNLSDISKRNLPKEGTFEEYKESLDFYICLVVFIKNWENIFSNIKNIDDDHLDYAYQLKKYRSKYLAHPTEKNKKVWDNDKIGERARDTLERFMRPIDKEFADKISALKYVKPHMNHNDEISTTQNNDKIYEIHEKCIIIKTRKKTVIERGSIYEAVRRQWIAKKERAEQADFVIGVEWESKKVINVYKPTLWYDTTEKNVRKYGGEIFNDRIAFIGAEAEDEIKNKYIDKLIPDIYVHGQNSIRYTY